VSALMHAGIVNAGGYLIIRASPIATTTPWALGVLALVGGVTAIYAATVMLTQTSVKKSLAYSTIAQMGFMMLQCGLGAFSAAMLHIVAHSMYKAQAFLGSGNVLVELRSANAEVVPSGDGRPDRLSFASIALSATVTMVLVAVAMALFGINPITKPGGLILGAILALALSRWICSVMRTGDAVLVWRSMFVSGLLALAYVILYCVADFCVAPSVPDWSLPTAQWTVLALLVGIGFGGMLLIERFSRSPRWGDRLAALYVHASNGFYVDSTLRRLFGSLAST
jgi:NAD(P)H-quinone oxidoreductase subunit 5